MVQDELLRMRVQFEAGALLAFEAAIAFDEAQQNPERRTWLRLATALAKYLTAEYAIAAARAALELIGGNGYTSDYPVARLLRDAQVLTVWEGPANIQALELLRLLAPSLSRMGAVSGASAGNPRAASRRRWASCARRCRRACRATREAMAITMRDEHSAQRYARKLLHRMSQSLAFALLCEAAGDAHARGNSVAGAQRVAISMRRLNRRPSAPENEAHAGACWNCWKREAVQIATKRLAASIAAPTPARSRAALISSQRTQAM